MKKLVNKKGFTLVEMLIVVAIIAILAVIAIPSMTDSLDKANAGTDAANLRTAKSVYATAIAGGEKIADKTVFNLSTGEFDTTATAGNEGKCTAHGAEVIAVVGGEVTWATVENGAVKAASTTVCTGTETTTNTPADSENSEDD